MKLFLVLLQLFTPLHIYAQQADGREISGTYAPGLFHSRNYVKNPGAEKNVLYTTNSASIVTRTTSTPVMGVASYLIDGTSSAQTVKFDTSTLDNNLKGQNCEARFTFTGDASLYKVYIEQGSTNVTSDLTLTNETYAKDVSIVFPCGDLSSNSHIVIETTSASAAAIKVDDVYLGKVTSLASCSLDTEWVSYSPTISGLGTVTLDGCFWRRRSDSMDIKCSLATGTVAASTFSIALPSNFTISTAKNPSTAPETASHGVFYNVNGTNANYFSSTSGGPFPLFSDTSTSTTVLYAAKDTSSSRFAKANGSTLSANSVRVRIEAYGIPIDGWIAQAALRPDQSNYNPTSFTPSTVGSQGFGTIAAESCFHQRSGKHMIINCKITAGTVAASEARITLPNSNSISSTEVPAIRLLEGYWIRSTATGSTVKRGTILGNGGNTYINFSNDDYTGTVNPLVAQNGSAIFSNSDVISFYARIPITGWSENQNAPLLVGSVSSATGGTLKVESASITSGGTVTEIGSSDWINGNCSLSTSTFTCTLNSGFTSTPACFTTIAGDVTASNKISGVSSVSTSSVVYKTSEPGVGNNPLAVTLICIGPR